MAAYKKIHIFFLALVLCLSLAGCGEKTEKPQQPTSPTGTVAGLPTGTPGTTGTVPSTTTGLTAEDIDLPADGWSLRNRGGMSIGSYGEGGYYNVYQNVLTFTDLSNGNNIVLCSKPGCLHYDEPTPKKQAECDAYTGVIYCIHYQDGKVYYVTGEASSQDSSLWLVRRNADGTGLEEIGRLASEYITKDTSVMATQYVFAGDMLYYRADVSNLIQAENGIVEEQATWLLMRMNLNSGKEELLEEYKLNEAPHLQGAREDMLLYYTNPVLTEEEENNDPDLLWEKPVKVKVWSETVGQSVTLFTYKRLVFGGTEYIANGKYYYLLYDEDPTILESRCLTYDLVTKQHEDTGFQTPPVLNGRYAVYYDMSTYNQYFYDQVTKSPLPMEYTNASINILTVGDEGAVLRIVQKQDNAQDEPIEDCRHIPYAALEDGLQKTDGILMPLT